MQNFKKLGILALFVSPLAFATFPYPGLHPVPLKLNPAYAYTPQYSCEGHYYGRWYLGYRVGEDSCDIQIEQKIVVRVYRYFPL